MLLYILIPVIIIFYIFPAIYVINWYTKARSKIGIESHDEFDWFELAVESLLPLYNLIYFIQVSVVSPIKEKYKR